MKTRKTAVVSARVDDKILEKARVVLAGMGLTIPEVIRMVVIYVANEQKLPFDPSPYMDQVRNKRHRNKKPKSEDS